ncbi:MAG: zinc-binding alcohol dehydrogenase [Planctomycetota bacterium]|nr:zinc-binding alcohol dehydrogenase [Planctomycetota bacterium]
MPQSTPTAHALQELICPAPHQLTWRPYSEPALGPGQIRIRAEFGAAKHGTEMSLFKGYANDRGTFDGKLGAIARGTTAVRYPVGLGNMVVGLVTEVGPGVTAYAVGDRALSYSGFRPTSVANVGKYCWKLPAGIPWQSAVCIDPANYALAAIRDGDVRIGDAVAVFSLGAIGLMAVQLLKLAGARPIIAVDPLPARRELALALGADIALDPTTCDAGLEIRLATGKRGADVVIEYSGARQALQDSLRAVAFGGTIVAGAYPPPHSAGLDLGAEAHFNIPKIVFSRACSEPNRDHPRWSEERLLAECLHLLAAGRISGERIVTPIVSFEELPGIYPKIATDATPPLKLGVKY